MKGDARVRIVAAYMPDAQQTTAATTTNAATDAQKASGVAATATTTATPPAPDAAGAKAATATATTTTADATKVAADIKDTTKPADAPVKYDLKLSDKSPLDASAVERVATAAKDLGLSPEQAQKFLVAQEAEVQRVHAEAQSKFAQQRQTWVETGKADKEIGGEKYDASLTAAKQALARFSTPQFLKELTDSGFGDHPELLRTFARIGASMGEHKIVNPGANSAPANSDEKFLRSMYPSMFAGQS